MVMKESPDTVLPVTATSTPETLNRSLTLWNSLTIGFRDRFTGGGTLCHHRRADGGDGRRLVWGAGALSRHADVGGDRLR